ncbi:MAG: amidase domain-containing protein, partial [Romboutsia sp.]|nr:amidase domain-containing protein [Romboutsia sp.]
MNRFKLKTKYIKFIAISLCLIFTLSLGLISSKSNVNEIEAIKIDDEDMIKEQYQLLLKNLFDYRNKAILEQNEEIIKELYDTNKKTGLWAYEHEVEKMKYLKNWSSKQGVVFNNIKTNVQIRKVKEKEDDLYGIICNVATDYNYSYENEKDKQNIFRIGTEHYLNVKIKDNQYIITKEWYTDPFADSLNLENIKSEDIRNYILQQEKPEIQLTLEQEKAIAYAHKYCGVSIEDEYEFKYNKHYKNFNPDGG